MGYEGDARDRTLKKNELNFIRVQLVLLLLVEGLAQLEMSVEGSIRFKY